MSDAPERIWASVWKAARRGKHTMGGYTNSPIYPGSKEYIRADLFSAAIARAERAEIEAAFFQGEVKLRNRIPATSDAVADLLRRAERAEAALALAEEALREIVDAHDVGCGLWRPIEDGRAALSKIAALKGGAA